MQWRTRGMFAWRDQAGIAANCARAVKPVLSMTGRGSASGTRAARRRFLIVHNAIAGMRRRWLLNRACQELEANGAELTLVSANSCETDRRLAAEAVASGAYDAVIAAGGDSTVRGVGSGLGGSRLPLGVIPIGTGNVLAEEIRFRCGPKMLARNLMYGPAVPVTAGTANGAFFFAMAGAGFDARVIARLNVTWKRRLGKLAYTLPIIGELARKPRMFTVEIDGESHECSWLVVAKVSRYGGPFCLTRRQSIRNDGFHAVIVNAKRRATLAGVVLAIACGRVDAHPSVKVVPCSHVFIPHQPGVPTQIDGEAFGETPMEIVPATAPVEIIFPLSACEDG